MFMQMHRSCSSRSRSRSPRAARTPKTIRFSVGAPVTGSVLGTPLYMSPEQCRGKAGTFATDAYSLGVLAHHVLVGEPPFSGDASSSQIACATRRVFP